MGEVEKSELMQARKTEWQLRMSELGGVRRNGKKFGSLKLGETKGSSELHKERASDARADHLISAPTVRRGPASLLSPSGR